MDDLVLVSARQLEVAVRVWHPDAQRTVIAWHGLARHGGDFARFARELGPDWRVLAPDTPGRGLSSWSLFPAHDYLYNHYMAIALELLDYFGLERVAWVGTSMGGLLGMLIAADADHGQRIERLVLNDVGPQLERDGLIGLSRYFTMTHRFVTFRELVEELKRHYTGFGIDTDAGWRELALDSARRLPDGTWTFHYDPCIAEQFVHDTPRDTWADWRAIRCPLMVVRGEDSDLLGRKTIERMRYDQPGMAYLEVPGCGHAPMLDRSAQVDPIRDFLLRPATVSLRPRQLASPLWLRGWQWMRRRLVPSRR